MTKSYEDIKNHVEKLLTIDSTPVALMEDGIETLFDAKKARHEELKIILLQTPSQTLKDHKEIRAKGEEIATRLQSLKEDNSRLMELKTAMSNLAEAKTKLETAALRSDTQDIKADIGKYEREVKSFELEEIALQKKLDELTEQDTYYKKIIREQEKCQDRGAYWKRLVAENIQLETWINLSMKIAVDAHEAHAFNHHALRVDLSKNLLQFTNSRNAYELTKNESNKEAYSTSLHKLQSTVSKFETHLSESRLAHEALYRTEALHPNQWRQADMAKQLIAEDANPFITTWEKTQAFVARMQILGLEDAAVNKNAAYQALKESYAYVKSLKRELDDQIETYNQNIEDKTNIASIAKNLPLMEQRIHDELNKLKPIYEKAFKHCIGDLAKNYPVNPVQALKKIPDYADIHHAHIWHSEFIKRMKIVSPTTAKLWEEQHLENQIKHYQKSCPNPLATARKEIASEIDLAINLITNANPALNMKLMLDAQNLIAKEALLGLITPNLNQTVGKAYASMLQQRNVLLKLPANSQPTVRSEKQKKYLDAVEKYFSAARKCESVYNKHHLTLEKVNQLSGLEVFDEKPVALEINKNNEKEASPAERFKIIKFAEKIHQELSTYTTPKEKVGYLMSQLENFSHVPGLIANTDSPLTRFAELTQAQENHAALSKKWFAGTARNKAAAMVNQCKSNLDDACLMAAKAISLGCLKHCQLPGKSLDDLGFPKDSHGELQPVKPHKIKALEMITAPQPQIGFWRQIAISLGFGKLNLADANSRTTTTRGIEKKLSTSTHEVHLKQDEHASSDTHRYSVFNHGGQSVDSLHHSASLVVNKTKTEKPVVRPSDITLNQDDEKEGERRKPHH